MSGKKSVNYKNWVPKGMVCACAAITAFALLCSAAIVRFVGLKTAAVWVVFALFLQSLCFLAPHPHGALPRTMRFRIRANGNFRGGLSKRSRRMLCFPKAARGSMSAAEAAR